MISVKKKNFVSYLDIKKLEDIGTASAKKKIQKFLDKLPTR